MLRFLLLLTMATAACAQSFQQNTAGGSQSGLFGAPSQQQQRLLYLCSLPENANSSTCLSSQRADDPFSGQGGLLQQGLSPDRMGTGYDLSYPPAEFMPTSPRMRNEMEESATPYPAMAKPYRITEPPTEFQRYVSASIGQNLPIFRASLCDRMPGTFMPTNRALVGPDSISAPDDELQITVWGQLNSVRRAIVDQSG